MQWYRKSSVGDSAQIHDRVTELLELVNLDPKQYRGRYPSQLSGGQQQRVGLARALAAKPSLMLLDEPFGAIDAINRTKLQDELMKIHKRAGLTCMFVTHDVTEALKLGTRIMIMNQGKIQQFDTAKKYSGVSGQMRMWHPCCSRYRKD